ncbi:PAS domain-containing protein [Paradesulfitobacterium ferrireducens]|uniref:PAS domain-containing protein n=1 Tax=Paradesulfitobacterium ferrireducens TaxID=2816476 RepID=UPI001AD8CAE4|nr:PAS domain-containing protein [Paradesulfitobacterium ferrireducens]
MIFGEWIKEFPGGIIVTDAAGKIIDMNEVACKTWEKFGGSGLIGKNILDVHTEPSRSKVKEMLETQAANKYTIDKNGVKKLIYQTPWYKAGAYAGFVELALEIPKDMTNYIRG